MSITRAAVFLLVTSISSMPMTTLAEPPDMLGVWTGEVRTVASGQQVRNLVAKGGALISDVELTLTVTHQEGEGFIGEQTTNAPDAPTNSIWGAVRSTGKEGVFVTENGGRGQMWFPAANRLEYCFANQTPDQMSAHCAVLIKQ